MSDLATLEQKILGEIAAAGDEAALEAVRDAIAALGPTHESAGSKLSRALAHVEACSGCAAL